jgi:hypothetical protein
MRLRALGLLPLISSSLALFASSAHADPQLSVTGRGTQVIALKVDGDKLVARVCASGACSADGGVTMDLPEEARGLLAKAKLSAVDVGDGRSIARLDAVAKDGAPFVALIAPPLAAQPAEPRVLFQGFVDRKVGEEGERRSHAILEREGKKKDKSILVGERREDAMICGRPAVWSAKSIDAQTLTLKKTSFQSLTAAEISKAPVLTAKRLEAAPNKAFSRLFKATLASSAINKAAHTATDGDNETIWAENAPGVGAGEFLTMSSSSDVGMTGVRFAIRPEKAAWGDEVAPKSFFLAVGDRLFRVVMPEDAGHAAGASYEVTLPEVAHAGCVAVVLDEAFAPANVADPHVAFAEITAVTELDAMSGEALAGALAGGGTRAQGAAAMLSRSGGPGLAAVAAAWAKLDDAGKRLGVEVADGAPCADKVKFFSERLDEATHVDAPKAGEPRKLPTPESGDLQSDLLAHARDRLRACPTDAAPVLARLVSEGNEAVQRVAAEDLALLKPAVAVPALLDALPKASDATRRDLRAALAHAAKNERAASVLRLELDPSKLASRPLVAQIDLLRAVGPSLAKLQGGPEALLALDVPSAEMRARFLLLAPAADLAKAGNAQALALVRDALRKDGDAHVRAHAAAVSAGVPALGDDLVVAALDGDVRVREAAVNALAGAKDQAPKGATGVLAKLVASDEWTFVRAGAAHALTDLPADAAADQKLAEALADKRPEVRGAVLDALGGRRAVSYSSKVRERLDDTEEQLEVRARAVLALGAMCDRSATDLLTKLAQRGEQPVDERERRLSAAAIAALGMLHPSDLDKRLAPLGNKSAPLGVREAAKAALTAEPRCTGK